MYNCDDEIPKQRKKRESSVSKSKNKARHKHEYKDCLFIEENHVHKGSYCTTCGKVKQFDFFDGVEKTTGGWLMLTNEELLEKYSDLEQIKVDKYFRTKYIGFQSREEDVCESYILKKQKNIFSQNKQCSVGNDKRIH